MAPVGARPGWRLAKKLESLRLSGNKFRESTTTNLDATTTNLDAQDRKVQKFVLQVKKIVFQFEMQIKKIRGDGKWLEETTKFTIHQTQFTRSFLAGVL